MGAHHTTVFMAASCADFSNPITNHDDFIHLARKLIHLCQSQMNSCVSDEGVDMIPWMQLDGFRAEYDGMPVFGRNTGSYGIKVHDPTQSKEVLSEYIIMRMSGDMVTLAAYSGPASPSHGWTGKSLETLKENFKKLAQRNASEVVDTRPHQDSQTIRTLGHPEF